jgi:CheY-like chemotaxis protein
MNTQQPSRQHPSIMLVDDDINTRELMSIVAESQGLFISIKEGALSALGFLHELNYDVDAVIIDLSLPDMDGITLTKQIRQNENLRSKQHPMKVFWFTGWPFDRKNPNDPIMLGAKDTHVEHVYAKPYDSTTILREVKETIEASEGSGEYKTVNNGG